MHISTTLGLIINRGSLLEKCDINYATFGNVKQTTKRARIFVTILSLFAFCAIAHHSRIVNRSFLLGAWQKKQIIDVFKICEYLRINSLIVINDHIVGLAKHYRLLKLL